MNKKVISESNNCIIIIHEKFEYLTIFLLKSILAQSLHQIISIRIFLFESL